FPEKFRTSRRQDLESRRTVIGAHRDDFEPMINHRSLRRFGSQGQQKSFLVGMKLTQFQIIRNLKGFKPILLMDDIFDKLDDQRIGNLMKLVNRHDFGQIFITDARPERTLSIISNTDCQKKMTYLVNGSNSNDKEK
ncbi:MAG TPA: hypothetical protein VI583_08095, partial [Cyclobacteriaceae bacterium]|nr:hypothetical protein [Cyclobacteriaceae bacterium]